MKNQLLTILFLFAVGTTANAGQWTKFLSCASDSGTLVVDRDSDNPDNAQFVITGAQAVNAIVYGMQGDSQVLPSGLHIYDSGNKLVISDLTISGNFNVAVNDGYPVQVDEVGISNAVLKYPSAATSSQASYPVGQYVFYNCFRQRGGNE